MSAVNPFAKRSAAFAVATVLLGAPMALPAGAAEAELKGSYNIFIGGIFVAKGDLVVSVDDRTYSARVGYQAAGLGGMFSGFRGAATSSGVISGPKVLAQSYYLDATDARKQQRVVMALAGGNVRTVSATPELRFTPERVPVGPAHKKNIVDPLSAILMPVANPTQVLGPAACERTLPIFDGWTRYDVRLSYKSAQQISVQGYRGPVAVCAARWIPVAGHRPQQEATKSLQENRDLETWLAPVGRLPLLVPYRISVRTTLGMLVVEATSLTLTEGGERRAGVPARAQ